MRGPCWSHSESPSPSSPREGRLAGLQCPPLPCCPGLACCHGEPWPLTQGDLQGPHRGVAGVVAGRAKKRHGGAVQAQGMCPRGELWVLVGCRERSGAPPPPTAGPPQLDSPPPNSSLGLSSPGSLPLGHRPPPRGSSSLLLFHLRQDRQPLAGAGWCPRARSGLSRRRRAGRLWRWESVSGCLARRGLPSTHSPRKAWAAAGFLGPGPGFSRAPSHRTECLAAGVGHGPGHGCPGSGSGPIGSWGCSAV